MSTHVPASAGIPNYMTRAEAAGYIRCGLAKLAQLTAEGQVPSLKVGRHRLYKRVDLDSWLDSHLDPKPHAMPAPACDPAPPPTNRAPITDGPGR